MQNQSKRQRKALRQQFWVWFLKVWRFRQLRDAKGHLDGVSNSEGNVRLRMFAETGCYRWIKTSKDPWNCRITQTVEMHWHKNRRSSGEGYFRRRTKKNINCILTNQWSPSLNARLTNIRIGFTHIIYNCDTSKSIGSFEEQNGYYNDPSTKFWNI